MIYYRDLLLLPLTLIPMGATWLQSLLHFSSAGVDVSQWVGMTVYMMSSKVFQLR